MDGPAPPPDAPRDLLVPGAGVRSQQNLCALEFARRVPAAAEEGLEFMTFGLAEFDPIAYIHPMPLLVGGTDEQLNRMAGVSPSAKTFTPKQGHYLAYIHLSPPASPAAGGSRHPAIFLRYTPFRSPDGA